MTKGMCFQYLNGVRAWSQNCRLNRIQLKSHLVLHGCSFDSGNSRGILRKIHYVINHAGLTERVLFNHPVWFRMPGHHVFKSGWCWKGQIQRILWILVTSTECCWMEYLNHILPVCSIHTCTISLSNLQIYQQFASLPLFWPLVCYFFSKLVACLPTESIESCIGLQNQHKRMKRYWTKMWGGFHSCSFLHYVFSKGSWNPWKLRILKSTRESNHQFHCIVLIPSRSFQQVFVQDHAECNT